MRLQLFPAWTTLNIAAMKLSLLALIFIFLLFSCSEKKQPPQVIQSLPVTTVQRGSAITYQSYPASVEGVLNIEIRPQVTGILEKTLVDDGQYVKKGEPMFRIEEAPFRERLNNALAVYKSLLGALSNAQIEIDKLTPLVRSHVVSDVQLRSATSARQTAFGNVDQAKADIAAAKINLGYTIVKAPASGYIGRLLRRQGSLVGPADPSPLTELSDVSQVHAFFALAESDFIRFRDDYAGRTLEEKISKLPAVELIMANDSAYSLKGKIDVINGQFDKNTGAITFRSTFKNPYGILRSGNTGRVKLGLRHNSELLVPQAAVLEIQDQSFVFTINGQGKVSKQLIEITGKSGNNYLIKPELQGGLREGNRIVVSGFEHLHEGDVIKPVPVNINLTANN